MWPTSRSLVAGTDVLEEDSAIIGSGNGTTALVVHELNKPIAALLKLGNDDQ